MLTEDFAQDFFAAVTAQAAERLRDFFLPEACIKWHCTDEQFTVEEYIRANCEYPGKWSGEAERTEKCGELVVTAARVWTEDMSFHVCSFFQMKDGKIKELDEYWGDDGAAPEWRRSLCIGRPIGKAADRRK